jgi:hypothetical protein
LKLCYMKHSPKHDELYAPCHKSCSLFTFEIIEKFDTFCGREHTYSETGIRNINLRL